MKSLPKFELELQDSHNTYEILELKRLGKPLGQYLISRHKRYKRSRIETHSCLTDTLELAEAERELRLLQGRAEGINFLLRYKDRLGIWRSEDIISRHKGHYFSKDTMRFFASRVLGEVFCTDKNSVYFVTSEKRSFNDSTRTYNVRRYDVLKDTIETQGTFAENLSRYKALKEAKRLAIEEILKIEGN